MPSFNTVLYSILGSKVKSIRESLGISQTELSVKIGLGRSSISNIEKGKQQPPLHIIYMICKELNTDIHSLLPTYNEIESRTGLEKPNIIEQYFLENEVDESVRKQIEELLKNSKK